MSSFDSNCILVMVELFGASGNQIQIALQQACNEKHLKKIGARSINDRGDKSRPPGSVLLLPIMTQRTPTRISNLTNMRMELTSIL